MADNKLHIILYQLVGGEAERVKLKPKRNVIYDDFGTSIVE